MTEPTYELHFAMQAVLPLWAHAKAAPENMVPYNMDIPGVDRVPALWWVKDQGTYLMSNGVPGLLLDGGPRNQVAYATNINNGDYWEVAEACGDDDFCEQLPPEFCEQLDHLPPLFIMGTIVLTVEGDKYSLEMRPS